MLTLYIEIHIISNEINKRNDSTSNMALTKLIALWRAHEIKFNGKHGWFTMFHSRGTIDWRSTVEDALDKTTHNPDEFMSAFNIVLKQV